MNKKYPDIMKLARVQIVLIPIFIFFKAIRQSVVQSSAHDFFKITLFSLPNFFQAITGVLVLTGIGLILNDKLNANRLKPIVIYLVAGTAAAIFVISQELNFYNLRGDNTVDYYDVLFSCIGVIVGYWIVWKIKPEVDRK